MQQDKVVANVVPATATPRPDFFARAKVVESVYGKYSEQMRPSGAFMHDKAEEQRLEERRWQS